MTLLQNTVVEPDGTLITGWVDVTVVGNPFRQDTHSEVLGPIKDHRFVGGFWELELPAGTYLVVQRRMDGAFHSRWTVLLEDSEVPVWLQEVLVGVPDTPTSVSLRGITSTAIDGSGHLIVTYTDGQVVDVGLVEGPPGSGTGYVHSDDVTTLDVVTQAAYDALVVKDAGTFYIIVG